MTRSVIVALTVLLAAGLATAGLGTSPGAPQIDILEQSSARTVFEVAVPRVDQTSVVADGREYSQLSLPGDVMATGTPSGVGMGRGIYLKDGDVVECTIEKLGTLTNPIVAS